MGLCLSSYDFFKDVETSLSIFEKVLKNLPEFEATRTVNRLSASRFDSFSPEGPALRALYRFLKETDPDQTWCGLHKTITNDGSVLWLCEEHQQFYEL